MLACDSQQHPQQHNKIWFMMAELRACPSSPALQPGQGWQTLVITGELEPKNQAWYVGQGWAGGPELSQSPPPHRYLELGFAGVVQKAHGGNCSLTLPCYILLVAPAAAFGAWDNPASLVCPRWGLQERSCRVENVG